MFWHGFLTTIRAKGRFFGCHQKKKWKILFTIMWTKMTGLIKNQCNSNCCLLSYSSFLAVLALYIILYIMCLPDSYHLNGVCQIPNTSLMSLRFQLNTSVWCLLEYQLESVCQSPTERRWLQKYVCRKVVCYKTMTEPLVQQDTSARFRSSHFFRT